MRYLKPKLILEACRMSFNGMSNQGIAQKLEVSKGTVSRWRKLPLWIDFEKELLAAEKEAVLNAQLKTAEVKTPA
jgi:uncharacterized protein YjcR